jgi:predicted TIM-barrel fold metal-dependent hydrolase
MRTIALEEHYATTSFLQGAGDWLAGQQRWTDPLCDLGEARIAAMDTASIDLAVLSLTAPGVEQLDAADATYLARDTNDELAAAVSRHPDRFAGFAAVPINAPDAAVAEIERAIRQLGFLGAVINGHSQGRYRDDMFFDPVVECIAALEVPIYLHPTFPPPAVTRACYAGLHPRVSFALSTVGWGWHIDTATHLLRLILGGVFDRHPNLQVIVGHMGEATSFMLPRFDATLSTELTGLNHRVSDYLRTNVHYTFANFNDRATFENLRTHVGAQRIAFSTDYPFGSMHDARTFLDDLALTRTEREAISFANAEALLRIPPTPNRGDARAEH